MSFNVTITTSILFKEATAESAPSDDHDTEADPVEDEDMDNALWKCMVTNSNF